ncbi:MAG: SpoIID/LytB domain-containing protein [Candidatus Cloacimonadota bacterium]|nr:SpoIID/LytB domain-containing protein [Candidatus Cloacimonadota bacterium]
MKKSLVSFLLAFFFAVAFANSYAAEIRNGLLFLDVEILPNASQIHMNCPGKVKISEEGSPFQIELSDASIIFEITEKIKVTPYWKVGIAKFTSESDANSFLAKFPECSLEKNAKIVWRDGCLQQKNAFSIYLNKNFYDFNSALDSKESDGWVKEFFALSNPEIFIYDENSGKEFFLTCPLQITSETNITVTNVPKTNFWNPKKFVTRTYCGNLKLKINQIGKLNLISHVDLENYIAGVVPNEIGVNVPMDALRAQAIAARSEALFKMLAGTHKNDGFDLCASVHCQVYSGLSDVSAPVIDAVKKSAYLVGIFDGRIINAVYSTNCGGKTANNNDIWGGKKSPYLSSIYDAASSKSIDLSNERNVKNWIKNSENVFCNAKMETGWKSKTYKWEKEFSRAEFENMLNRISDLGKFRKIKILKRGESGRILKMQIEGSKNTIILDNELQIRRNLGGLRSSLFIMEESGDKIIFSGKGSGHGVGMCQIGAIEMSKRGYSAEEILKHYFSGIKISKINLLEE